MIPPEALDVARRLLGANPPRGEFRHQYRTGGDGGVRLLAAGTGVDVTDGMFQDLQDLNLISWIVEPIHGQVSAFGRALAAQPATDEGVSTDPKPESAAATEHLDFAFIRNPRLRAVLVADCVEAHQSHAAGLYKASALLAAGVIEGMLLDRIQRAKRRTAFSTASQKWQREKQGKIEWGRVGIPQLVSAASALSLISEQPATMARGVTDYRDTVHPLAEIRLHRRARREDTALLLALLRLLYRELGERLQI